MTIGLMFIGAVILIGIFVLIFVIEKPERKEAPKVAF
jgi:hypothetical protein